MRKRLMFSYVVDHDKGYSPNPVGGLCTLAHCKFSQSGQRRNLVEMAEVGDWVLGTGGISNQSAGHGHLIYAMRVTDKIPLRDYATTRRYAARADHAPQDHTDEKRFALISDSFFYFGCNAIDITRIPDRHLTHPIEKRGPSYRCDFPEAFIADFERWIAREFLTGISGEPCAGAPPHWKGISPTSRSGDCAKPKAICDPKPTCKPICAAQKAKGPVCPPKARKPHCR